MRPLLIALLLAGCAPRPVPAPSVPVQRDEVRGALLVTWEGLKVLHASCVDAFKDRIKRKELDEAGTLGQACAKQIEEARAQLEYALTELPLWVIDSHDCRCKVAARMGPVVGAYEVLKVLVRSKSDEVDDGYARALWLAKGCD